MRQVASSFSREKAIHRSSLILLKNNTKYKERSDIVSLSVERTIEEWGAPPKAGVERYQGERNMFAFLKEKIIWRILGGSSSGNIKVRHPLPPSLAASYPVH
ncbi:hypothetical protein EVAR_59353_1 [Eumeta japonica]|uniref:Uncharacterized protein n=1 Tax=Eumeta variegata TaxID=151549 RepID=A0A4C2A0L7_EUMVA|nr:hypothetical protein EVAR_59353_1 [Eumeta japonica]